jgi:hypothetical protein
VLLAVVHVPADPGARLAAAKLTALAPADFDRRLVGVLPRILLNGVSPEAASELAPALEALGYLVVSFAPEAVPGDGDRIVAHRLDMRGGQLEVEDAAGHRHHCPEGAIALLQRGVRVQKSSWKTSQSERKLDLTKAVLSGGLLLTRKVERTTVHHRDSEEGLVLVERSDGDPDIIVPERGMDYRFLAAEMQPSSRANLEQVWRRLRELAPRAAVDERMARPAFVSSLPLTAVDPVDLGLYLVSLSRARLSAGS